MLRDTLLFILIGVNILLFITIIIFLAVLKAKGKNKFIYDLGITAFIGSDLLISSGLITAITVIDYFSKGASWLDFLMCGVFLIGGIAVLCLHFWIRGVISGSKETIAALAGPEDSSEINLNNFR